MAIMETDFAALGDIEPALASNWCWVSSVQNVMSQAGLCLGQPQIAARLHSWPKDRPAKAQELVILLGSYNFRARRIDRPASTGELSAILSLGWKDIAFVRPPNGLAGHYIVLQGICLTSGDVIVSDPSTGCTYRASTDQIYRHWWWGEAVVVGAPGTAPPTPGCGRTS